MLAISSSLFSRNALATSCFVYYTLYITMLYTVFLGLPVSAARLPRRSPTRIVSRPPSSPAARPPNRPLASQAARPPRRSPARLAGHPPVSEMQRIAFSPIAFVGICAYVCVRVCSSVSSSHCWIARKRFEINPPFFHTHVSH